jgi:trans-aconitate 2-methyltransferase
VPDARKFYDAYVDLELATGINDRHHSIMRWLRRAGLGPRHRVLEIGCGIGQLTELLAKEVGDGGSILAMDLSPRSVEVAGQRLAGFPYVELVAGDILETEIEGTFDVVVLPDVIEHIPIEGHGQLFARVAASLKPTGFVLLHYPNPHYLAWCHENTPDALQVIDQPIHADQLLANAYPSGLYLDFFQTYPIWIREGDYAVAVLRPSAGTGVFTELPPGRLHRMRAALRRLARRSR